MARLIDADVLYDKSLQADLYEDSLNEIINLINEAPTVDAQPVTVGTPKIVRFVRGLHGVTCVKCGRRAATRRSWNRRCPDGKS